MKAYKSIRILIFVFLSIYISGCAAGFSNFISTEKDKLKDGEEDFRFISYNIPNLHYIEDHLKFESVDPWRLPDEFEIRDALRAIKQTGGNVTRMYVLSVRKEGEEDSIIRHVFGPGKFNEEAFVALDKVLKIANEEGVRVIIPFVDNWKWWGGPKEYAAFRGKQKEEFWTDSLLISDIKKTIEFVINRRNTQTGKLYKEDKAILGWETGNELEAPYSWAKEIAAYIKSLDKNHLLIEGTHTQIITQEAIEDTNFDVLSTHYYVSGNQIVERVLKNKELSKGKKPYFVGEFGFIPTKDVEMVLDTVINNDISGIMIWSLRGRNKDGGFLEHSSDVIGSYRWPGFESGNYYDEKNVVKIIREKAHQIRGKEITPIPVPDEPNLLFIETPYKISWQGSTGASSYIIERKLQDEDWQVISDSVCDANVPYRAQFSDTSVVVGNSYFYRVKAKNESGISDASNIVGPVEVNYKMLIDDMADFSKCYYKEGVIEFLSKKDIYKAKEDKNRITGDSASFVVYKIPGNISAVQVDVFLTTDSADTEILASVDSINFVPIEVDKKVFIPYKNEYGMFTPAIYSSENLSADFRYIKIMLNREIQISRIEIKYLEEMSKVVIN